MLESAAASEASHVCSRHMWGSDRHRWPSIGDGLQTAKKGALTIQELKEGMPPSVAFIEF